MTLDVDPSFGPRDVREIPLELIIPLSQIRREYLPAELDELAETMVPIGDGHRFELINSLTIAALDEDHIGPYLDDLNEAWGTDYDWHTFPAAVDADGQVWYFPLIAGHRRDHGIWRRVDADGLDSSRVSVSASIKENISFEDAFALQFRENYATLRPPAADEARGIGVFHRILQRHNPGQRVTAAAVARKLGCSEDKVRAALRFNSLPPEVQAMAHSDLPYGVVVALSGVYAQYLAHHRGQQEYGSRDGTQHFETAEDAAAYETATYARSLVAKTLQNTMRSTAERLEKVVTAHVEMLRIRFSGEQGELDLLLADTPHLRRSRVNMHLGKMTLAALELLASDGQLSEDMRRQLAGLATRLGVQQPAVAVEAADLFSVA